MLDAGSIEAAWRCECQWLLALVCLRASEFCVVGGWDSPSESAAAFLLVLKTEAHSLTLLCRCPFFLTFKLST